MSEPKVQNEKMQRDAGISFLGETGCDANDINLNWVKSFSELWFFLAWWHGMERDADMRQTLGALEGLPFGRELFSSRLEQNTARLHVKENFLFCMLSILRFSPLLLALFAVSFQFFFVPVIYIFLIEERHAGTNRKTMKDEFWQCGCSQWDVTINARMGFSVIMWTDFLLWTNFTIDIFGKELAGISLLLFADLTRNKQQHHRENGLADHLFWLKLG